MRHTRIVVAVLALATGLQLSAGAGVRLTEAGGIYTIENARFRLQIDANGGARIRSWTPKPAARDLIGLWKTPRDIGGALDDRVDFTGVRYRGTVVRHGPDAAAVRFEARNATGLTITKTLAVRGDEPAVHVDYAFSNATQAAYQPFIRSIFMPGGGTLGPDFLYWVHADPSDRQPLAGAPGADGYYRMAAPAYAAMWNRRTGDGVFAYVPGAAQFYFWTGSRVYPTFEWLYPSIPAGRVLRGSLVLAEVSGARSAPDWSALRRTLGAGARTPMLSRVSGWQDEVARFHVTAAERRRGWWLSIGEGDGKRRVPDPLPLDLPIGDDRMVAISLNALRDFAAPVRVSMLAAWRSRVAVSRLAVSPDRCEVVPLRAGPVAFQAGRPETLWLRVGDRGERPGVYRVPLRITAGNGAAAVNLRLHVWPVRPSKRRPAHMRGYWAGPAAIAGGTEVTPQSTARFATMLKAYAAMGGDVLDWNWGWAGFLAHVKLAGTGESLTEVAKTVPGRIDLKRLPRLDFSYYDPWLAVARRLGVTRVDAYMEPPDSPSWQGGLLDPALGRGRVRAGTPEADRAIAWFYAELKRWFREQGFHGFFCKISDEIAPDYVPQYIAAARVASAAGWHPFTTITGFVAQEAHCVRELRPWCDQWQLSLLTQDDFLRITVPHAKKPAAVPLKRGDEVWFYGGDSFPYRGTYGAAWAYPAMALFHRFQGYAQWAFSCGTDSIVWLDPATLRVTTSPPWWGFRDGYRDAELFAEVIARRGRGAFDRIVGRGRGAIVRIGTRTTEVYHYSVALNTGDPLVVNAARREALRLLAGGGRRR